jgi:hypothetical protein
MPASYVIAAYNDMAKVRDPAGGVALLIGLEAFIPLQAQLAAGHNVLSVGYGRLEAGGWALSSLRFKHQEGLYRRQTFWAMPTISSARFLPTVV